MFFVLSFPSFIRCLSSSLPLILYTSLAASKGDWVGRLFSLLSGLRAANANYLFFAHKRFLLKRTYKRKESEARCSQRMNDKRKEGTGNRNMRLLV